MRNGHRPLATAFLHFLCTPCGHSGLPTLLRFFGYAPHPYENHAIQWRKRRAPSLCSHPLPIAKILMAIFFLNCTKNTELTRAHFARTVSFAFTKISKLIPAA